MRKFLLMVLLMGGGVVWGIQRGAVQRVEPTFLDTGNAHRGFTVQVGSTTPILVYSPQAGSLGNYPTADRKFVLQNFKTAFVLFCGTSTSFTATSGNRWVVQSSSTYETTTLANTYCLYDVGGSTREVIGRVEYDTAD